MADNIITVVKARCRSWLCPHCGPWLGRALRHRLILRSCDWVEPILITVTVGRGDYGHERPIDAYHHVMQKRCLARLLGQVGITRWVSILEPQRDGFPHWHILADGENRRIDYKKMHDLWKKWGIGEQVDVKRDFASSSNAINYITKYIIKRADKYPPWMYAQRRLRVVQGSRSVGPLTGDGRGRKQTDKALADDASAIVGKRIPAVRVSQCGAVLVHVDRSAETGDVVSVERVAIIPEQRFHDLTGIHQITCPFTGARSFAVDRERWDAAAMAWRREEFRVRWLEWVNRRAAEYLGFSPPGGKS